MNGIASGSEIATGRAGQRTAVFVAGDEKIFFPAIVALHSIDVQNPGQFDLFICFGGEFLTDDQRRILKKYDIRFIDSRSLGADAIHPGFRRMYEGTWPIDVFYNWFLPKLFAREGYAYSIKCDYDVLCISPYQIDEMLPDDGQAISGLLFPENFTKSGLTRDHLRELERDGAFSPGFGKYMNVGFVCFDNARYVQEKLYGRLAEIYGRIHAFNPRVMYLEQVALAVLMSTEPDLIKGLDRSYNHRIRWVASVNADLTFDIKNIHYITPNKPWRPINADRMYKYSKRGQAGIYVFRNIWLDFAEKMDGFLEYCTERKLTERQYLGMIMKIVGYHNFLMAKKVPKRGRRAAVAAEAADKGD